MTINTNLASNAKTAVAQVVDEAGAWLIALRDKVYCWLQELDLTPSAMIEICSYLGGGFLVGFLLKKYFRAVIVLIILLGAAVWGLVEFDLISVNWSNAQNLAHVAQTDTLSTIVTNLAQWCKQHVVMVISCLIGFLIGHKLGQ